MIGLLLLMVLVGAAAAGAVVLKYRRIVGAKPGALVTGAKASALGRWVNPFIGTGGCPWVCGHNFPGAMVPFGMVRLGPETSSLLLRKRALNTSGYFYGDDQVLGFSHTRLVGTGATDGGHFLVAPAVGPIDPRRHYRGQSLFFSHRDEIAFPGYYAVRLRELGVLVELTATPRVGLHRYTFNGPGTPRVALDVANALGGRPCREGRVRVRAETSEVEGAVRTFGTFAARHGGIKVYFAARFNCPIASYATWRGETVVPGQAEAAGDRVGADLSFAATNGAQTVTLALAISYVSVENARANLEAEVARRSFDEVLGEAQRAWEDKLSLILIDGGTEEQRTIFYTALYRAFQMPTVFNDANGDYIGFDGQTHRAAGFRYFTDLSLWDTFRTAHPLYTLIAPQDQRDMVASMVKMIEQGGGLPRWPAGDADSHSMLGAPADIVIADSYLKGIRDFDVEKAYRAMRQTALAPTPPGAAFSGRVGVEQYLQHRYCPAGLVKGSVARTLEFGWADQAISALAEALGHDGDAALFREHAKFYRNLWNPQTQYFQPRDAQGRFVEPFEPRLLTYLDRKGKLTQDYVEGSALQWRWGAPFDAEGLVALFRSREYFAAELDRFFAASSPARGAWSPGPDYWHGNEPDIHAAYLFNAAGRPDLTQKWARWIMDHKYGAGYDGLDGNDDAGTLSAWFVFSALGLYPVAGTDKYELGTPLFERAEVRLGAGRLIIAAQGAGTGRWRVRRVSLDDRPLERTWVGHAELGGGAVLRFLMQDAPQARGTDGR